MVRVDIWLSTLRSLTVEVVTLVLCQVLVGLPSWCCCASGFLGPVVFLVFPLGHLSQVGSAIVTLLSLLSVGLLLALVRIPCLRLTLWALACVGPGGCPAFSRVGPAPSTWVPLLWTWLAGEAPTVFLLLCLPSGCGHPLGSIVSFVTIDSERRFPLEVVYFAMLPPI